MSKDLSFKATAAEQCIRLLSAEILRLSRMPYASWRNMERIRNLDDQIMYLEEILAAYERDHKKNE